MNVNANVTTSTECINRHSFANTLAILTLCGNYMLNVMPQISTGLILGRKDVIKD